MIAFGLRAAHTWGHVAGQSPVCTALVTDVAGTVCKPVHTERNEA